MKFVIIASNKDTAGKNIFKHIHENFPMLNHYLIKEESIYADNIDKKIEADFFIFATKHKSQEHRKTFSVHAPGNWKKAEMGGKEGKICKTSGFFLKHIFKILNKEAENSGFETTLEVTHHGPYIEKPCCFLEIGSSEQEWKDIKAGEIIAETIKKAIDNFEQAKKQNWKTAIGIGGKHYCPNFNKIQLNSSYALSHIIPEYALPISEEILKEAINKTQEKVSLVIIDWKSLNSEQRKQIINLLNKFNLKYKKTSEIEKSRKLKFSGSLNSKENLR